MGSPRHVCPPAWRSGGDHLRDPSCRLTSQGEGLRFGNEEEFGGDPGLISRGRERVQSASSSALGACLENLTCDSAV